MPSGPAEFAAGQRYVTTAPPQWQTRFDFHQVQRQPIRESPHLWDMRYYPNNRAIDPRGTNNSDDFINWTPVGNGIYLFVVGVSSEYSRNSRIDLSNPQRPKITPGINKAKCTLRGGYRKAWCAEFFTDGKEVDDISVFEATVKPRPYRVKKQDRAVTELKDIFNVSTVEAAVAINNKLLEAISGEYQRRKGSEALIENLVFENTSQGLKPVCYLSTQHENHAVYGGACSTVSRPLRKGVSNLALLRTLEIYDGKHTPAQGSVFPPGGLELFIEHFTETMKRFSPRPQLSPT
jgi:hypothetical protein